MESTESSQAETLETGTRFLGFIKPKPEIKPTAAVHETRPDTDVEKLSSQTGPKSVVKRALLIGINYFGQSAQLNGCINDIMNMRNYLQTCGFTEFTILKDERTDRKYKNPDCPTRDNIIAAMKKAVAKTQDGDVLYVHYSGHGSHVRDLTGDEIDMEDECICPVDYDKSGFIIDDDLNKLLVQDLKKGATLRVCFDSCHSGSALDLPNLWKSDTKFQCENRNVLGKDVVFISGCMDTQTSADAVFNGLAAGAMTWSLLGSLWDMKKSGQDKWTWKELIQMMRMKLRVERYEQIPQLSLDSPDQIRSMVDLL